MRLRHGRRSKRLEKTLRHERRHQQAHQAQAQREPGLARMHAPGVAVGVLGAVSINFALMAHLSLQIAGMPWREFSRAHLPAVALTTVIGPAVWIVASVLRHWQASPVVIVVSAGTLVIVISLLLVWSAPSAFLGADGQWMVSAMRKFMTGGQKRSRASKAPAYPAVAQKETRA